MQIGWRPVLMIGACLGMHPLLSQESPPLPPAGTVLERMIDRGQETQAKIKEHQLAYSKRSILEKLGQDGSVKDREETLYDVRFKNGRVRMTVLAVNGRETKAARQRSASDGKGPDESEEMKSPRGEERPLVLTEALLSRYDFEVTGTVAEANRGCYILRFQPKPDLDEEGVVDRFLNRLGGKIWVDQSDYEVVRAEIGLLSSVQVFGGLVGAIHRFQYTLERTPVGGGVWFNRASHCEFELRKLLVSRHYRAQSEWQSVTVE